MSVKIALTGKMRSGKDTVADYLVEHYDCTKFAFGDELKRYAHEIFNVSEEEKPRDIYQRFGQYCRAIDEDVWVRKCFENISAWEELPLTHVVRGKNWLRPVITDLRQPNEFDECKRQGFTIIRVNCPDSVRLERMKAAGDRFNSEDLAHETEIYIDGFDVDFDVWNSGKVTDTYEQIDVIMRELGVGRVVD